MNQKQQLVVKNNKLNQFTFYKSTVQLKVFSKLILEIRKYPEQERYKVPIFELLKEINFKEKGNAELKKIVRGMGQMVEVPKEKGFKFSALFYEIETEDSTELDFLVNPSLKPYLLEISSNFTSYYFENITNLKSYYSIRIYELLKQYLGKKITGWWKVSIEDLRDILKIETKHYKLYGDFKRKVILQAQKEIDKKTDIKFTFEEEKKGRKVEIITFFITSKNNKTIEVKQKKEEKKQEPKIDIDPILLKELEDLKIDNIFIRDIIKIYPVDRIKRNLEYTKKELANDNINSSVGGYFREALKRDYANQPNLFTIKTEEKKKVQEEKKKVQEEKVKELNKEQYKEQYFERLKKEFEQAKKDLIYNIIEDNLTIGLEYYKHFQETRTSNIYKLPNLKSDELMEFVRTENKIETSIFRASFYEDKIDNKIDFIEFGKERGAIIKKEYDNFVIVDLD